MNGRRGVALVSVLLLLLVATGLAHGVLLLARAERTSAIARVRASEAHAVALDRLDESLREGTWPELSEAPIWARRLLFDATGGGAVVAHRLGPESWWLEYRVDAPAPRRIGVPGRLSWWMDPLTRMESLGAVLSVGHGVESSLAGTVDRSLFGRIPTGLDNASCALGSRGWTGDLPEVLGVLEDTASRPGLGLLPFDTLLARTSVVLDESGTMEPLEASERCVEEDGWNWGDPEALESPCGEVVAVRAARTDLRVEGGVGQAAVLVDGDLELAGTARLYGFVFTTGVLRIRDEAELHGAAVAVGGLVVEGGARVQGAACWAGRALRSARAEWMPRPSPVPHLPAVGP